MNLKINTIMTHYNISYNYLDPNDQVTKPFNYQVDEPNFMGVFNAILTAAIQGIIEVSNLTITKHS